MGRRTRSWIAVAAAVAGLLAAGDAHAAAPAEWKSLAREIADPWPELIDQRGHAEDYVQKEDPQYGPPMLGYALLQSGLRDDRRDLVDAGLRALNSTVRETTPKGE